MSHIYIFMGFFSHFVRFSDLFLFLWEFLKLDPNHFLGGGVIKPPPQKQVKAHKMLQVSLILVPLLSQSIILLVTWFVFFKRLYIGNKALLFKMHKRAALPLWRLLRRIIRAEEFCLLCVLTCPHPSLLWGLYVRVFSLQMEVCWLYLWNTRKFYYTCVCSAVAIYYSVG